jgi:SAM-dependent methyltransferase
MGAVVESGWTSGGPTVPAPDRDGAAPPPLLAAVRRFWDEDAATYDRAPGHRPQSAAVLAAWRAALARRLPPAPARVLDVGAGTGFLSLLAASLGHQVTAVDLSPRMLDQLARRAAEVGVEVETVVAPADEPPAGFDVVVERHLLWTLPDPAGALAAWRAAAAGGQLLVVESVWGAADPVESVRGRLRAWHDRLRRRPSDHHAEYDPAVRQALPLGSGTPPAAVVAAVEAAGWSAVGVERLADVEWAERFELGVVDRALGVAPRFCVTATDLRPDAPAS